MMAEEPGTLNPGDSAGLTQFLINDGRWDPVAGSDPLTTRHGGKADVAFVDGHVDPVNQDFGAKLITLFPGSETLLKTAGDPATGRTIGS